MGNNRPVGPFYFCKQLRRLMKDMDNGCMIEEADMDEEQLFLDEVIQGDYELLYLDTFLREICRQG